MSVFAGGHAFRVLVARASPRSRASRRRRRLALLSRAPRWRSAGRRQNGPATLPLFRGGRSGRPASNPLGTAAPLRARRRSPSSGAKSLSPASVHVPMCPCAPVPSVPPHAPRAVRALHDELRRWRAGESEEAVGLAARVDGLERDAREREDAWRDKLAEEQGPRLNATRRLRTALLAREEELREANERARAAETEVWKSRAAAAAAELLEGARQAELAALREECWRQERGATTARGGGAGRAGAPPGGVPGVAGEDRAGYGGSEGAWN